MKRRFKNPTPPGTQAVGRAIAILRALAGSSRALGVTEVAAALDVNKAAVFRLLGALEGEGFVVRDDADAYRLGPALIALGISALGAADLRSAAHAELVRLVEESGETATLEILDGQNILIVDEVIGHFLLGSVPELGLRWPAYATSSGKVLLAFGAGAKHPRTFYKRAARTITTRTAFARELDRVRERGYAIASEELEVGFSAAGAPVFDHRGVPIAAICVNGPTARIGGARLEALAQLTVRAAARVSERIGAPPRTRSTSLSAQTTVRRGPTRRAS